MMKLYTYWRSTAAYRVRVALHYKGIDFESIPVHLVKEGGQQHADSYQSINPQSLVPTLETDHGNFNQSIAIIDYLESQYPDPSLYPSSIADKAYVQSLALQVACDIHPLNNLRVLKYLQSEMTVNGDQKNQWYQHWVALGFTAIEKQLQNSKIVGEFCYQDQLTIADICLVAQVYNAVRFQCDLSSYPLITRINENCLKLDYFQKAKPENQADAVS